MLLTVDHVTRRFAGPDGSVTALDGVSLEVMPGEFVAVRGPSGCGKSTLLLTAGTLLRPTAGRVVLDGVDAYGVGITERRLLRARSVGFVFQQFHLLPYLSVIENILTPAIAMPVSGTRERALRLAEQFGLTERLGHRPAQLSTGEKQRTALARALLNQPKLLLADEPTGNLDPENGRVVLEALAEFAAQGGGVLMVTHERNVGDRANRVIHMVRGQLA
ncbi:MAG: ABC transporter ATP-binding protein [Lentisphaeria bacterium]|nr:ABC transporter ATP-binding protein [Lentisphaeria bacterium]